MTTTWLLGTKHSSMWRLCVLLLGVHMVYHPLHPSLPLHQFVHHHLPLHVRLRPLQHPLRHLFHQLHLPYCLLPLRLVLLTLVMMLTC